MKPRVSSMAPSIHFHDAFSSFFFPSRQGSPSSQMSMQISLIFQPRFKEEITVNSMYSKKLQSPLAKDTDEGKDFIKSFMCVCVFFFFFFRSFSGLKGKTSVGQSIYNQGLPVRLHAKNLNFPEYLEPGKKHEVGCAPWAGGLLRVHSQVSTVTVCHIIFLSQIFLFI